MFSKKFKKYKISSYGNTIQIIKYYQEILNRYPDEGGLFNYLDKIKNKKILIDEIPNLLRNSKEFKEQLDHSTEQLDHSTEKFDLEYVTSELHSYFKKIFSKEMNNKTLENYIDKIRDKKLSLETAKLIILSSIEAQVHKNENLPNFPIFNSKFSSQEILRLTQSSLLIPFQTGLADSASGWYHSFRFNEISIESGTRTSLIFQMRLAKSIPDDLLGMTVLDIGTADGFYSFLCEQRGAKHVLSIDNRNFPGFNIAKQILDSKVEHKKLDLYDLDQINETFDFVLCFGVYYHLPDLVSAFQKLYSKTNKKLLLSGHILYSDSSIACLYDEYEIHPKDRTNWWVASPSCIKKIAKRVGFTDCQLIDIFPMQNKFLKTKNSVELISAIGLFEITK